MKKVAQMEILFVVRETPDEDFRGDVAHYYKDLLRTSKRQVLEHTICHSVCMHQLSIDALFSKSLGESAVTTCFKAHASILLPGDLLRLGAALTVLYIPCPSSRTTVFWEQGVRRSESGDTSSLNAVLAYP